MCDKDESGFAELKLFLNAFLTDLRPFFLYSISFTVFLHLFS